MFLVKKAAFVGKPYYQYMELGEPKFTVDVWHAARFTSPEVDVVVKHLNMLAAGDYTVYATPARDEGIF